MKDGIMVWAFAMEGRDLYDVLCSLIAWRVINHKPDLSLKEVRRITMDLVESCNERSDKEIAAINDPFILSVLSEKRRLGIKQLYTRSPKEKKSDEGS